MHRTSKSGYDCCEFATKATVQALWDNDGNGMGTAGGSGGGGDNDGHVMGKDGGGGGVNDGDPGDPCNGVIVYDATELGSDLGFVEHTNENGSTVTVFNQLSQYLFVWGFRKALRNPELSPARTTSGDDIFVFHRDGFYGGKRGYEAALNMREKKQMVDAETGEKRKSGVTWKGEAI